MITFEEAYNIAKEIKPEIDNCVEYENVYCFGASADAYSIGPCPVCVSKADGTVDRIFVMDDRFGKEIGLVDMPEEH